MTPKPILYLDAGHGGSDSGAVGAMGLREKDVALAVVLLMGAQLTDIFDVRYTRKDDTFIPLATRAEMANRAGAVLFVSVHCNSAERREAIGFEVFTTLGQTDSDVAATHAFRSFAATFPTHTKRMDTADGDEDKESNFAVLRLTDCAAFLFELAFISNEAGEVFLRDKTNQAAMAGALARGIRSWYAKTAPAVAEPVTTPPPAPVVVAVPLKADLERIGRELLDLAAKA